MQRPARAGDGRARKRCAVDLRRKREMKRELVFFIQSPGRFELRRLRGVYEYAQQVGWHVLVVDRVQFTSSFSRLLDFWHPIGCIVEGIDDVRGLRPIAHRNIPLVFCDAGPKVRNDSFWLSRACFVVHDPAVTTELAVRELLKTGWRDMAFVGSVVPQSWSRERLDAFRRQVEQKADRRCHAFTCEENGPFRDVMEFQRRLRSWLADLPKPCAIMAGNDFMGEQVILACNDLGLSIPQQIVLIGVDDDELRCEHLTPTLASVEPDFDEAGRMSALLLDGMIGGSVTPGEQYKFGSTHFIRRQSAAFTRKGDPVVLRALEKIRREACGGVSSAEILSSMGCSRSRAERLFRQETGCSVQEKIEERRLVEAQRLLANTNLKIELIADSCGYRSGSFLRKLFRERIGMSMQQYRMNLRRNQGGDLSAIKA